MILVLLLLGAIELVIDLHEIIIGVLIIMGLIRLVNRKHGLLALIILLLII